MFKLPALSNIPGSAAIVLIATLLLSQAAPLAGWGNARLLSAAQFGDVFDLLAGHELEFESETSDPAKLLAALLARKQRFPLVDASGSLNGFFAVLQQAERGQLKKQIHILHYGDSPTTADLITADVRARLQDKFGNGGYG
ncbi:MAG: hypothetical protein LC114_10935, partial [Bryobacterales bacterium]|nr:hypothetical protein [Bryobacterales bacterium]